MSAVLYRCFDASGRLLYVGSTSSWKRRMREHQRQSWWWSQMSRVKTIAHPTLESARAAESTAIQEEGPVFNWRDAGRSWLGRRDAWTPQDFSQFADWHHERGLKPPALTPPLRRRHISAPGSYWSAA